MAQKKKFTDAQLKKAMAKVYRSYRHRRNFTGADIGYRWSGGKKTNEKVVRVHVTAKLPLDEVKTEEVFPAEIDGVPLDVIEGPYKRQRSKGNPKARAPVLMGGISIGRPDNGAGTLGAMVVDKDEGWVGALSNWHVLAGPNREIGDPILQPGRADGGRSRDQVATLTRWILNKHGDAAVARLTGARPWMPSQINSGVTFEGVRNSRLNEVLVKQGRSTGETRARVDGEGIYRIMYEVSPRVEEPRDIEGFKLVPEDPNNADDIEVSEGGDSGSFWYNPNDKMAVGLHFAGETASDPMAEQAIACNLVQVLDKLGLRLADTNDLAVQLEGLSQTAHSRPELTPLPAGPDWPNRPWPPRWPFPIPPRRPWSWPGPWPNPWPFDDRSPMDDPRDFDLPCPRFRDFGLGLERTTASPIIVVWDRLKRSLRAYDPVGFRNVKIGHSLTSYWVGVNPHEEIAWIIEDYGQFSDIIPPNPYPNGSFFQTTNNFQQVCRHIIDQYY